MRNVKFNIQNAVMPIIGINVLFFLLQILIPGFTESLSLVSGDVLTRPWILLSSMFLHGSFFHIFINMYILLMFGSLIERRIGTKRFVLIYFLSGILASIGFVLFQELLLGASGAAVGASGAIMGILGVAIMILPDLKVLLFFVIPMSLRTAGIIFVIIELLGTFGIGIPGIANIAHLVGLATGLLFGYYLVKKRGSFNKRFSRQRRGNTFESKIHMSEKDMEDYFRYGRI
jgi:uncharacterized protein